MRKVICKLPCDCDLIFHAMINVTCSQDRAFCYVPVGERYVESSTSLHQVMRTFWSGGRKSWITVTGVVLLISKTFRLDQTIAKRLLQLWKRVPCQNWGSLLDERRDVFIQLCLTPDDLDEWEASQTVWSGAVPFWSSRQQQYHQRACREALILSSMSLLAIKCLKLDGLIGDRTCCMWH